jgi:hypothetical protein
MGLRSGEDPSPVVIIVIILVLIGSKGGWSRLKNSYSIGCMQIFKIYILYIAEFVNSLCLCFVFAQRGWSAEQTRPVCVKKTQTSGYEQGYEHTEFVFVFVYL